MDEDYTDQYTTTGAMNFATALVCATTMFTNLIPEAQEEVNLVIVDRAGGIFIIGVGELFPTNEDAPVPQGFVIYRDDIIEFLEGAPEDEGEEGEPEESEPTDGIGAESSDVSSITDGI